MFSGQNFAILAMSFRKKLLIMSKWRPFSQLGDFLDQPFKEIKFFQFFFVDILNLGLLVHCGGAEYLYNVDMFEAK